MENFTPFSALVGGAIIGLSAVILLLFKGRIAGVSGIVGGVLLPTSGDFFWRVLFVIGLIAGGMFYQLFGGSTENIQPVVSAPLLMLAGLLVGIGTTLGSGCTSGHGICGISRLSIRSIVATVVFMLSGIATVFIVRHVFGA